MSPYSRRRSLGVDEPDGRAALMSNESAYPLQTDSDLENRRGNGMEGWFDNNLQILLTRQFQHLYAVVSV